LFFTVCRADMLWRVPARVEGLVATTYVADIAASRQFYGLLGFRETRAGEGPVSAWSYLSRDDFCILLVSTTPTLGVRDLPLLFYFYVDDVDAMAADFEAAGQSVEHEGYPPHALGGEVKLVDPDGNTILLGQRERSESQRIDEATARSDHFSLLRESAALIRRRGGAPTRCEVAQRDGARCEAAADVKLADSWGDTAWACLPHAEEVLVSARGAFLATTDDQGLGAFLKHRTPRD
jgi:catechol 2,3-dioxygenase-like lactoylglutathione lyase family enzyme